MGPPQGLDPCASFLMPSELNAKPLADIALLEEVLRFQDCRGTTLFLKHWGGSPEWEEGALEVRADAVKGPLSMVLQDGSEVVFPENASSDEDPPSDKELSNF
uniref:Uncharacterized protein n=1 Tax=Vitis vinifera TaxID=29760 RepID=A5BLC7_VITVI|nr:hypothetical protein VITISV_019344 [Vitis vinifera]